MMGDTRAIDPGAVASGYGNVDPREQGTIISRACRRARAGGSTHYAVIEMPVSGWEPIDWLTGIDVFPRLFWHGRWSDLEYACAGRVHLSGPASAAFPAADADAVQKLLHDRVVVANSPRHHPPRAFFATGFDRRPSDDPLWGAFPAALMIVPEATLIREGGHTALQLIMPVEREDSAESANARLAALVASYGRYAPRTAADEIPPGHVPETAAQAEEWARMVGDGLRRIEAGEVHKVVLSREVRWRADGPIPLWTLVRRLRNRAHGAYHFALQIDADTAFVGASPERLFRVSGQEIETECVAGTVARDADEGRDAILSRSLLASAKDRLEHGFVIEDVLESLRELCHRADVGTEPWILRLPTVQHLVTTARGELRDDVRLGDVLRRLHPTSAVGGTPRAAALAAIREIEGRTRGWYAAPIGWISAHEAEFAVAIRSAVVRTDEVRLFVGAGIVPGSTPKREWDETEAKAQSMLSILQP